MNYAYGVQDIQVSPFFNNLYPQIKDFSNLQIKTITHLIIKKS